MTRQEANALIAEVERREDELGAARMDLTARDVEEIINRWAVPPDSCPHCGGVGERLSTTNEWEFYCARCAIRFNGVGEVMENVEPSPR